MRALSLVAERVPSFDAYPFNIPAVRDLGTLDLDAPVTISMGENGAGKSTLIEAIAVAAGFNAEGGSRNFRFSTRDSTSELHRALRLTRGLRRPRDGFFLRAESFFNAATYIESIGAGDPEVYGPRPLHEQSHGEAFLALVNNRFRGEGLYILDEPEAALSPGRQLALLQLIHRLVHERGSQIIMATHSPLLLAYPGATVYQLNAHGIGSVDYRDTDHFQITRTFLASPERYFQHLFKPGSS